MADKAVSTQMPVPPDFRCGTSMGAFVPYIPMLRENNVRKGFFEHEDFVAVRDALTQYLKPLVTFAYHTGWRREEILGLTWKQVDLREGTVRLEPGETKNRQGRTVYLEPELLSLLKGVHGGRRLNRARVSVPGKTDPRIPAFVAECVRESRGLRDDLPRPPADRGTQHGSCRHSGARRDGDLRAQDQGRLRSLQYRVPGGSQGSGEKKGGLRGEADWTVTKWLQWPFCAKNRCALRSP